MAGRIRGGIAKQLSPYGFLAVCQLELSTAPLPGASLAGLADAAFRVPGADVPGPLADRMVLDEWFCGGIGVATNSLGKHGFVLFAMFILLVEIPR